MHSLVFPRPQWPTPSNGQNAISNVVVPSQQQPPRANAQHEVVIISDDDNLPDVPAPPKQPERAATSGSSQVKAPSFLRNRLSFLEKNIHNDNNPIAIRLLHTLKQNLDIKLQKKYCTMFWPDNETALADIYAMAEYSPNFSEIYFHRIGWAVAEAETDPEKKELTAARMEEEKEELRGSCRQKFRGILLAEICAQEMDAARRKRGTESKAQKEMAIVEDEPRGKGKQKAKEETAVNEGKAKENRKRKSSDDEPPKKRGRPKKLQKTARSASPVLTPYSGEEFERDFLASTTDSPPAADTQDTTHDPQDSQAIVPSSPPQGEETEEKEVEYTDLVIEEPAGHSAAYTADDLLDEFMEDEDFGADNNIEMLGPSQEEERQQQDEEDEDEEEEGEENWQDSVLAPTLTLTLKMKVHLWPGGATQMTSSEE